MKTPKVSVLIPCYNVELYVEESVRSIMNQTYSNLEILVIDDGSTDKTAEILQKLAQVDNRIKFIKNETNLKLIATLNKGIELCTGKYIARMDADDISLPTRIEKQVRFLEKNLDIGIVGSYTKCFGEKKQIWRMETSNEFIKAHLFYTTCFSHPSVMFRKSIIQENHLRYNLEYPHSEDYKLWCDFSKVTKLANLAEVLLLYRINKNQVSQRYKEIQEEIFHKIRRELLNNFCEEKKIEINFEQITFVDIQKIKEKKITKAQLKYLLFIFYLALNTNYCSKVLYLFCSFDFIKIGLKNVCKVLLGRKIKL